MVIAFEEFEKVMANCFEVFSTWDDEYDKLQGNEVYTFGHILSGLKGQLISKADWWAIDSPKKQTDEFVLFAFLLFMANKSNSSICFLGESAAH